MKTRCLLLPGGAALALAVAVPSQAQTDPPEADFLALDSPRREVSNFNVETVRGMVFSPDRTQLFAINTHGSRLVMHDDGDGLIDGQWTTVHNPVAIAVRERGAGVFDLLVLGGATHALALHDPVTGAIEDLVIVPSEPGDLIVTPDDHAWVSCMGANVVVEIELSTFEVLREYPILSQRPRFLSWEVDESVPAGYRVYVAPFVSGNNTRSIGGPLITSFVAALPADDPSTPAVLEGLPDEDLFELIPPPGGSGAGTVAPLVKGLGTLILEHARNPVTGEHWILSIVSKNADPAKQTETALGGDFADNALTLVSLPAQGQLPVAAPAYVDLDDSIPNNGQKDYATSTSCSFPFAVAIDEVTGWSLVASSTNDRLVLLNPQGNRTWQRDLPTGSIPRDVLVDRPSGFIVVYLWGTNQLWVVPINNINAPPLVLDVGNDSTPASIAAGREHWYDGENSLNGRSTCNTCHPGGASDFLGWPLSTPPEDRKDVMVTQSLLGIEDTFPYHWRGERQLRDFNRKAFPGLLGGTSLDTAPGGAFDEFKEFVFSLQPPRNPHESWDRVVSDAIAPTGVSAVQGQTDFNEVDALFGAFTCAECHAQPEGTVGAMTADNPSFVVQTAHLDVAHLRQLFNKELDTVTLDTGANLPRLGFAIAHEGRVSNIQDFVNIGAFSLTDQQRLDIAEFVRQFDQGITPPAQLAWLLDHDNEERNASPIKRYLLVQAGKGWLDAVAFGTVRDALGQQVFARWLYDPVADTFQANDASVTLAGRPPGTAVYNDFVTQAIAGTASNTFLGLPPGGGRVFALDPDNDRLDDGAELAIPTDPEDPDSDGDGDPDGHEVANGGDPTDPGVGANDTTAPGILTGFPQLLDVQARVAEYELRFDEPVTYTVTYQRAGDPPLVRSRFHSVVEDTITLQELRPSSMGFTFQNVTVPQTPSTYGLSLSITDLGGNTTIVPVAQTVTAEDNLEVQLEDDNNGTIIGALPLALVVDQLSMNATKNGGTLDATVNVRVAAMHEGLNAGAFPGFLPQENQVVVAQILLDTGSGFQVVPFAQITSPGAASTYLLEGASGPLNDVVVSPLTDTAGDTTVTFSLSGLNPGDVVQYNVVGIFVDFAGSSSSLPDFTRLSSFAWQLPSTEDDPGGDPTQSLRGVSTTF